MSLLEALRQPHALYVLQHAKALLPGIQRMVACFYYEGKIQTWQMEAGEQLPAPLQIDPELQFRLSSYRHRARQEWISMDELEFDFQKSHQLQKDVFDEVDNHVLLLSFTNDQDKGNDCIFFYFNKDASNFGLRKKGEVLSTDSKAVISNILKQSLNLIIKQRQSFEQEVNQYKNYLQRLSKQYKQAKDSLQAFKDEAQDQILQTAQSILQDLAAETNYEIILTEHAKAVLREQQELRPHLPDLLRDAVMFAIYSSPGNEMVTIEDWHLNLDGFEAENLIQEKEVDVRYQKTFTYLNKLEEAARKAYSQHLKLTGKNVGLNMTQPISAPAITDALRNHQKNIYSLFDLYPDRWSLIRKEFRPITNLIDNRNHRRIGKAM